MERDIDKLLESNEYLRKRLHEEQRQTGHLREEVARWKRIAEEEHKSWIRTHSALNLVVQDAQQVMREYGAISVHQKLLKEREERTRLLAKRQQWRAHARRATEAKVSEAQRARDLDEVVEAMRKKLVEITEQRDAAVAQAEKITADQKAKLDRIEEQCRLWRRGELDTMTTIAGISGEFQNHPLPEPGTFERLRALQQAQTTSLMAELTDQLQGIELLLEDEGVSLVNTHVKQVKDYIELMKGRVAAAEDRGR